MDITTTEQARSTVGDQGLSPFLCSLSDVTEVAFKPETLENYHQPLQDLQALLPQLSSDSAQLEAHLNTQLSGLFAHAVETCAFYKNRIDLQTLSSGSALEQLQAIAPISKRDLQLHYDDLWSNAFYDDSILNFWMTSGSTGEPTRFIVDEFASLSREVSFWFTQWVMGNRDLPAEPSKTLMLRISSAEGLSVWYKKLPFFNHALLWKMSVFKHPKCNITQALNFIDEEQPLLLGGDPQAFLALIDYWQAFFPAERAYPFELKGITCGGTQLSDDVRLKIERFFRVKVTNTYGLSEVGIVATQCEKGALHIHTPVNLLEVVDKTGNTLPDGAFGDLVVTNLLNWAFPLIRYHTGDMGRIDRTRECPCGLKLPILYDFQGRKRRMFLKPNGEMFSPNALVPLFVDFGFHQYQLIQEEPTRFRLRYIPKNEFSPADKAKLTQAIEKLSETEVKVSFEAAEQLQEPGVKFQDFISLCHASSV